MVNHLDIYLFIQMAVNHLYKYDKLIFVMQL